MARAMAAEGSAQENAAAAATAAAMEAAAETGQYEEQYLLVQNAARAGALALLAQVHLEALESRTTAWEAWDEQELAHSSAKSSDENALRNLLVAARRSPVPFSLTTAPSGAPGGGYGLFVASSGGGVAAGSVVAWYPGLVYLRARQTNSAWEQSVLWSATSETGPGATSAESAGDYLVTRFDGTVVDGRIDVTFLSESDVPPGYDHVADGPAMDLGRRPNRFAMGHVANHPPPLEDGSGGSRAQPPNALLCPLDLALSDVPTRLLPYVPNRFWQQPSPFSNWYGVADADFLMRTVVLVASRDVAPGEEVFVDYRFSPSRPRPAWYRPVDPDADAARWATGTGELPATK